MLISVTKTIASGTTADFPCPSPRHSPVSIEFPAAIASTTYSLHALKNDGSTYGLLTEAEANAALMSGLTCAASAHASLKPTTSVHYRGRSVRLVMGTSETSKTFVIWYDEYA